MNYVAEDILKFWFEELTPPDWFKKNQELDLEMKKRFLNLAESASCGECYLWRQTPEGRLAEILVLDQFSRNIYRDSPKAWQQDGIALVLAQEAVSIGVLNQLDETWRSFLLMPYMHSESKLIHEIAVPLFEQYGSKNNYDYELRHKAIIDQFGRYPHRNKILGRVSTPEEVAFLQKPNSGF